MGEKVLVEKLMSLDELLSIMGAEVGDWKDTPHGAYLDIWYNGQQYEIQVVVEVNVYKYEYVDEDEMEGDDW